MKHFGAVMVAFSAGALPWDGLWKGLLGCALLVLAFLMVEAGERLR